MTNLSSTTLSQTEVSKLPMRQLTTCRGGSRSGSISKLPMRQLTPVLRFRKDSCFSKLPMRQLTGVIYAIILILLDLHKLPLIEPKI